MVCCVTRSIRGKTVLRCSKKKEGKRRRRREEEGGEERRRNRKASPGDKSPRRQLLLLSSLPTFRVLLLKGNSPPGTKKSGCAIAPSRLQSPSIKSVQTACASFRFPVLSPTRSLLLFISAVAPCVPPFFPPLWPCYRACTKEDLFCVLVNEVLCHIIVVMSPPFCWPSPTKPASQRP